MSMPMYFPDGFIRKDAIYLNQLVDTAYDMYHQWITQGKPAHDKFDWKHHGPSELHYGQPLWSKVKILWNTITLDQEPFAFVAWKMDEQGKKIVYLVFRGTESKMDWVENLEADQVPYDLVAGYGKVHHGFYDIYKSMREAVHGALDAIQIPNQLVITGHSLGSSLSTLSVPDIQEKTNYANVSITHYNLASPRTGDRDFVSAYNRNGVVTYRIVNTCDIVPNVPPSVVSSDLPIYSHVGTPVDFTAQYGSIVANHSASDCYLYALNHPDAPEKDNGA